MHPVLNQTLTDVETLLAECSADRLAYARPGSWSDANTLEHLALAYGGTTRMLYWLRDRNAVMPDKRSERQQQMIDRVLGEGNFPSGQSAPPSAQPTGLAPAEAVTKLRESLFKLDAALTLLEQTFGSASFLGDIPYLARSLPRTGGVFIRSTPATTSSRSATASQPLSLQPIEPPHAMPGFAWSEFSVNREKYRELGSGSV